MPSEQAAPIQPIALFEILVRENADSLTAFLRASVDDAAAVDDLFQETLLIAWRRLGEFDRSRPFGAWLRGIAKRLVLAYFRKSARDLPHLSEEMLDHLDSRMLQIDRQPGDTLDEKLAALRQCLERLAPMFHESIGFHYREQRSTDWIAQHLSTMREAIQKRLQRARTQLAECLQRKSVFSAST